jgi:hypothetical protein
MEDGNAPTTLTLTGATNVAVEAPTDCYPADVTGYALWLTTAVGKPPCWCYARNCYGDADGLAQGSTSTGYYYVGSNDLNLLIPCYLKTEPPFGSGITFAQQCANFAHDIQGSTSTGYYYVGSNDLNLLIPRYLKTEPPFGSGVLPDCPAGPVSR